MVCVRLWVARRASARARFIDHGERIREQVPRPRKVHGFPRRLENKGEIAVVGYQVGLRRQFTKLLPRGRPLTESVQRLVMRFGVAGVNMLLCKSTTSLSVVLHHWHKAVETS